MNVIRYLKFLLLFCAVNVLTSMTFAAEGPHFSAFTYEGALYVTILADSCNSHYGILTISNNCYSDQDKKSDSVCTAKLQVGSTRIACHDTKPVPRILEINLKAYKLSNETKALKLTYDEDSIEVPINR